MRLEGKSGIVVGAGQTPGETIGNGRAASVLFAREGAKVLLVDRDLASAEETAAMIAKEGGVAECVEADWTKADQCKAYVDACVAAFGRVDFLHNNVGIGAGDATLLRLEEDVFDRIMNVNLKGCLLSCQAVLPVMREQKSGSIVNISSIAAVATTNLTAYKISKLGMNALGQNLANSNARHGIRVNTIMPGLMDTPMAIEGMAEGLGITRDDLRAAATEPCRCGASKAPVGTSPMPRCSSTPTTPPSSPVSSSPSTAAKVPAWVRSLTALSALVRQPITIVAVVPCKCRAPSRSVRAGNSATTLAIRYRPGGVSGQTNGSFPDAKAPSLWSSTPAERTISWSTSTRNQRGGSSLAKSYRSTQRPSTSSSTDAKSPQMARRGDTSRASNSKASPPRTGIGVAARVSRGSSLARGRGLTRTRLASASPRCERYRHLCAGPRRAVSRAR